MFTISSIRHLLPKSLSYVVVRLRLVLVIMTIVTTAVAIVATLQTRTILEAKQHLNTQTLPALMEVQHLKAQLNALLLEFQRLAYEDEITAFFKTQKTVTQKSIQIRKILKDLYADQSLQNGVAEIDRLLTTMERVARSSFQTRKGLLQARQTRQALLEQAAAELENAHRLIETTNEKTPQLPLLSRFSSHLQTATNPANRRPPRETAEKLRQEWQTIQEGARLLPRGETRASLEQAHRQLEPLLFGPDGLLRNATRSAQLLSLAENSNVAKNAIISKLNTLSNKLVGQAHRNLVASSASLSTAARNLVWVLAGALLIVLLIVLLTNTAIIERQISQRMKRLNGAVNAISQGDLQYPIDIQGSDEIGEMAIALAIFKNTALELRRSNEELEKFAYVAAHDLRSPLRAIRDLSEWTMEDETNHLSEESRAYLTMLQSRTDRLSRLLADLLDYARAGQDDPEPQLVLLERLVSQISLTQDPEGQFNIRYHGPDMPVGCHLTALTQTLSNLLSNAIKHHDRAQGHIEVFAWVNGGRLYLRVHDDGPGIEPKYQARILELFQTLRPRDEVEGSGLGLAIVGKLVEHYGGRLNVQSNPSVERGATFEVDLPFFDLEHPADMSKAA